MNPYHSFVSGFAELMATGRSLPLGGIPPRHVPPLAPDAPVAMIFSPHPDDECIIGSLALRLMRETGMRVINVAVTQGSNKERQQPRWEELRNACKYLGFNLEQAAPNGLEKISPKTRLENPGHWSEAVKIISTTLARHKPRQMAWKKYLRNPVCRIPGTGPRR